jgi:hypothetical protein
MTTSNGAVGDQVEGIVEARNDRGIKVAGEWRNQSKFHPLELPGQGARVRLELDGKGFIKSLQVLDQAPAASSSNRDSTITRLVCLKAAATFCASKALNTEVSTADVLKIAEAFERWVQQERSS